MLTALASRAKLVVTYQKTRQPFESQCEALPQSRMLVSIEISLKLVVCLRLCECRFTLLSPPIKINPVGRPTVNHSVGSPSDNKINKLLLIQFLRIICFKFVVPIITDGTDVLTGENRRKRSVVGSAQRHGFYVRNSTDRKPLLRKSRSLTKKQTNSQPSLTLI